jgi:putative ABC transport system permease protein
LLCEGLVLAAAAGTAALIVCVWAGNALRRLIMPSTYWADSAVDVRVVGFIGLVALGTGVLAGLVPALQASRPELAEALKSGARDGGASAHRSRLRQLLLIAQIAMSVLLLYGAGLFVHSLVRLRAIDLGFDADRVVYGSMYLLDSAGKYLDPGSYRSPRAGQALMQTAQRMMASPDVEQVALSTGGPLAGYAMIGVYNQDGTAAPELDKRSAVWYATTPSFFDATGAHLARGRLPSKSDRDGPPVMVVNETAARFYWPQREAIGQCLRLFRAESPCVTVIGVVRDSHVSDVVEKPVAQLVTPFEYDSSGRPGGASTVIVRAKPGRAAMVQAALRRELLRDVPTGIAIVAPASERLAEQLRPWRVGLLLFGAFGALAFVLAALGTYSVLSYAVTQRLHEISVRMALGARGADVLMLVVAQGVRTALIGVVAGLTIAMLASRVMQSMLYDTSPQEPLVTIAVASLLLAMAAAASALPARRAARLDPAGALRAE